MKKILLILAVFIGILSCTNDDNNGFVSLDLMKYGVPLTIQAPDSAEIKTMDFGVQKDISVKKGKDYYVEIFSSDAMSTDIESIKNEQLKALKENPYFSKIIQDDKDGFIYENQIDSTSFNYGFRHIKVQGDKEYIFQTGLIGTFSKEATFKMYSAVK